MAIQEQEECGLSVSDYCQLIEKNSTQFYYWKRKLDTSSGEKIRTDSNDVSVSEFIELKPSHSAKQSRVIVSPKVDIYIGSFSICFSENTDIELFKVAATILKEIAG